MLNWDSVNWLQIRDGVKYWIAKLKKQEQLNLICNNLQHTIHALIHIHSAISINSLCTMHTCTHSNDYMLPASSHKNQFYKLTISTRNLQRLSPASSLPH